jgi:hypothetical protein
VESQDEDVVGKTQGLLCKLGELSPPQYAELPGSKTVGTAANTRDELVMVKRPGRSKTLHENGTMGMME